MLKILIATFVTLSNCFSFAGQIQASAKQKGVNESVTIQNLGTNWGYEISLTGWSVGTDVINLVPVTREAAEVLQSLDKKSKYKCIIENSTFVPKQAESQESAGTYFVLDINCN